jgi:hypothetical protein
MGGPPGAVGGHPWVLSKDARKMPKQHANSDKCASKEPVNDRQSSVNWGSLDSRMISLAIDSRLPRRLSANGQRAARCPRRVTPRLDHRSRY